MHVEAPHPAPCMSSQLQDLLGVSVYMYPLDVGQHRLPHIHVRHASQWVVLSLPDARILDGHLPFSIMKHVRDWIERNRSALMQQWDSAIEGVPYEAID